MVFEATYVPPQKCLQTLDTQSEGNIIELLNLKTTALHCVTWRSAVLPGIMKIQEKENTSKKKRRSANEINYKYYP